MLKRCIQIQNRKKMINHKSQDATYSKTKFSLYMLFSDLNFFENFSSVFFYLNLLWPILCVDLKISRSNYKSIDIIFLKHHCKFTLVFNFFCIPFAKQSYFVFHSRTNLRFSYCVSTFFLNLVFFFLNKLCKKKSPIFISS